MAAVGWALAFLGLLVLTYAYYDVYITNEESVLVVAGALRMDVLGLVLTVLGLVLAVLFHFLPTKRPSGPQPEDRPDVWIARGQRAATWERTHRILASIGWAIVLTGIVLAAVAFYVSWVNSADRPIDYVLQLGGTSFLYWRIGVALSILGAALFLLTYPRIRNAREARQGYLLAALASLRRTVTSAPARAGAPDAEVATMHGVTAEEVKALLKKVDQLLSKLPEGDVAAFAQSREAEAYLKLLDG